MLYARERTTWLSPNVRRKRSKMDIIVVADDMHWTRWLWSYISGFIFEQRTGRCNRMFMVWYKQLPSSICLAHDAINS